MKLLLTAVVIPLLAACQTRTAESSTPRSEPNTTQEHPTGLQLSAHDAESMNIEEFVKACQKVSGFNFTYTKDTAEAMEATPLNLKGATHVAALELPTFLATTLEAHGFTSKHIGPEHLNVVLIERKKA